MRRTRLPRPRTAWVSATAIFSLIYGCGSDSANTSASDAGAHPQLTAGSTRSLAIKPTDLSFRVTDPASLPAQALTAEITYDDGRVESAQATWSVSDPAVAMVTGGGLLRVTGERYGDTKVTATVADLTASADIHVSFDSVRNDLKLPPDPFTSFVDQLKNATTKDPAIGQLLYPYEGTVLPRSGLLPPELMWTGSSAGDRFLVHLAAPADAPRYDFYVASEATELGLSADKRVMKLDSPTWNAFVRSAAGSTATIEVRRLSAGKAYVVPKRTVRIADANLRGDIYYWELDRGQVVKLDVTTGTNTLAFDSGPASGPGSFPGTPTPVNAQTAYAPAWDGVGNNKRCVACHSVSKDGSTLAASFSNTDRFGGGGSGPSGGPSGFVDLKNGSIRSIGDYTEWGELTAINPNGSFAILNTRDTKFRLKSTANGQGVVSALDGLSSVCQPSFSPDGTLLAFGSECALTSDLAPYDARSIEFNKSNLSLMDVTTTSPPAFANKRVVLNNGGAANKVAAYPSFSPDSKWVFFQGGTHSYAKHNGTHGDDDLFVLSVAGGQPVALDNANGVNMSPPLAAYNMHTSYAPTVNPIAEGGYFWVVFMSPRDYGHRMVAGSDPNYNNHKQLWVAAVDANVGKVDPSHPAFWLPGQEFSHKNMFGYWSLSACKPTRPDASHPEKLSSCTAGFECCSGYCHDDGKGPVCTDTTQGCKAVGDKCSDASDCCNGGVSTKCAASVCQQIAPH